MSIFSSARDAEIIAAGGFYCHVCAVGKPVGEKSPDLRYCQGCADLLAADKTVLAAPDIWSQDDMVFTHYGRRYTLSPGLRTICLDNVSDGDSDVLQTTYSKEKGRQTNDCEELYGSQVTQKAIKGRKPLDLPVEKVLALSGAGKSIREIAGETLISRETVRRIVNGQRVLVEAIR